VGPVILVAFCVWGCSFTFENALLMQAFRPLAYRGNKTVPMYAHVLCKRLMAGRYLGWWHSFVSMRAMPANRVEKRFEISSRYPWGHGSRGFISWIQQRIALTI